jgi:hypothetical protein
VISLSEFTILELLRLRRVTIGDLEMIRFLFEEIDIGRTGNIDQTMLGNFQLLQNYGAIPSLTLSPSFLSPSQQKEVRDEVPREEKIPLECMQEGDQIWRYIPSSPPRPSPQSTSPLSSQLQWITPLKSYNDRIRELMLFHSTERGRQRERLTHRKGFSSPYGELLATRHLEYNPLNGKEQEMGWKWSRSVD